MNKLSNNLQKGHILSETSYYIVDEVRTNSIIATNNLGQNVTLSHKYVDAILKSGDVYSKVEQKNMTELAIIFKENKGIAMSVEYVKADKKKTKKAYEAELLARAEQDKQAFLANGSSALVESLRNPVTMTIPGEIRLMKGHNTGSMNEQGRFSFVDMETPTRIVKVVDPRTIRFIIVEDVKYVLKTIKLSNEDKLKLQ